MKKLNYNVLDKKRKSILPGLSFLKDKFYLAGGTALALQIGHRVSVDFDYFTINKFDNLRLFNELQELFVNGKIEKIQDVKDTLSVLIDNQIKLSFFAITDKSVLPLIKTEYFSLLPVLEIGAMKLAALTRAAYRDYVDLYYILKKNNLNRIFDLAGRKYKNFDKGIYLKCLLSYNDVELSPIKYKKGFFRKEKDVFAFIEKETKKYIRAMIKHP